MGKCDHGRAGGTGRARRAGGARAAGRNLIVALALLAASPAAAECTENSVELRGDWGQARFSIELADEPEERSRGLMFREKMPRSSGMLFVFDEPTRARFWMKNTLIPLDMIFTDENGRVTRIHENAIPLDETTIDGGDGVYAVLEINGGLAAQYGIDVGTELRHPAFGNGAAWPCPSP